MNGYFTLLARPDGFFLHDATAVAPFPLCHGALRGPFFSPPGGGLARSFFFLDAVVAARNGVESGVSVFFSVSALRSFASALGAGFFLHFSFLDDRCGTFFWEGSLALPPVVCETGSLFSPLRDLGSAPTGAAPLLPFLARVTRLFSWGSSPFCQ